MRLWLFAFDFQVRRGGQLIIDYPSKTTATAASIRCAYAHHRASHRSHNTTWFLISDFPLAKEQVAPCPLFGPGLSPTAPSHGMRRLTARAELE